MHWQDVDAIYQKYQLNKGPWRQFFRVNSVLFNAVYSLSNNKNLDSTLTLADKFNLIKAIFKTLPNDEQRLSYQYAKQLVAACITSDNLKLFNALKYLYSINVLNEKLLDLLIACQDKVFISNQLEQLTNCLKAHPDKSSLVLQNIEQAVSLEYHLGQLFEQLLAWESVIACYKKAIEIGKTSAMYDLGRVYQRDRYSNRTLVVRGNQQQTLHWYRQAITNGEQRALNELKEQATNNRQIARCLGEIYETGGVNFRQNIIKALTYYQIASDLGDEGASYILANQYEQRANFDPHKAFYYYAQAALQGHHEANEYLVNQASTGTAEAQYVLGYFYYLPRQDMQACIQWCVKAAQQNHVLAKKYITQTAFPADILHYLGQIYEQGDLIPKQLDIALNYYQQAAEKKHVPAILRLAVLYQSDELDANKSDRQSFNYFKQAVALGASPEILYQNGQQYEQGKVVPKQPDLAINYYAEAAQKDYLPAVLRLAELYQGNQLGIATDNKKAFSYYKQAALLGCSQALIALQRFATEGDDNMRMQLSYLYRDLGSKTQALFWQTKMNKKTQPIQEDNSVSMAICLRNH